MADIKISEMPVQAALTGDELLPAVDLTLALALRNRQVQIEQIVPKGGTTGQVLTKTNGTSYATQWATSTTPAPVDLTYLTTTDASATLTNSRRLVAGTNITFDDSAPNVRTIASAADKEIIQFACSDLITFLQIATGVGYVRASRAFTLNAVRASLKTVSSSGLVTIDINKNGTTILSTKLTIDANEKTSVTAATPAVISDSSIADDDEITIDIDGAGTGAVGLVVTLIGTVT